MAKEHNIGRYCLNGGTATQLRELNPKLYRNELVLENDTGLMKIGDGINRYNSLSYANRGVQGEKGETGAGLTIKGSYSSEGELPSTGSAGDAYIVSGDLFVWTGNKFSGVGRIQGIPGVSPHVGTNGNWYIGDADTGVKARPRDGIDGNTPVIGPNGNWHVGGVDTNKPSRGQKGDNGDTGNPLVIRGYVNSVSEITESVTAGDCYLVGTNLFCYDGTKWIDCGRIKGDKGEDAINTLADENQNGLLSSTLFLKLNNMPVVPENAIFTDTTYDLATNEENGLFPKEMFNRLNNFGGVLAYTGGLNNLNLAGMYSCRGNTNRPSEAGDYASCLVLKADNAIQNIQTDTIQVWIDNNNKIFVRNSIDRSNTWTTWQEIGKHEPDYVILPKGTNPTTSNVPLGKIAFILE